DNRFAEPGRADQGGERSSANVDDGACFDSGENRSRRQRKKNLPQSLASRQAEHDGRLAQWSRDILQSGGGVANNRQQTVKKKGDDGRACANSEKRQRHEQRQQSERWNRLN